MARRFRIATTYEDLDLFHDVRKGIACLNTQTVMSVKFLWRSAFNRKGARIANVGNIKPGDKIVVAWRHSGQGRMAYLLCQVAAPLLPVESGLIIDRMSGSDSGQVEGIRLDQINECWFPLRGEYGGNNATHQLSSQDVEQLTTAKTIPPGLL